MYDSVPSETYDLRILDFETGESEGPAGGDSEIFEKYVYRKSRSYYYGRTQNTPLEFDLTIGSFDPISGIDRNLIEKWLLGKARYMPFQIMQDDISDVIFNVIFTSSTVKYIGNVQRALTLHGRCDAPWGFTYPKRVYYNFTGENPVNYDFNFYNESANNDYLYPTTEFQLNSIGTSFQLINYSDIDSSGSPRTFLFTGLQPNELVTINNDLQIVSSSSGEYRLSNFNKKWFRLVPGLNKLNIQSGIGTFEMTYSFAKKVGA